MNRIVARLARPPVTNGWLTLWETSDYSPQRRHIYGATRKDSRAEERRAREEVVEEDCDEARDKILGSWN